MQLISITTRIHPSQILLRTYRRVHGTVSPLQNLVPIFLHVELLDISRVARVTRKQASIVRSDIKAQVMLAVETLLNPLLFPGLYTLERYDMEIVGGVPAVQSIASEEKVTGGGGNA